MLFPQLGVVVCGVATEEDAILEASPTGERKVFVREHWEGLDDLSTGLELFARRGLLSRRFFYRLISFFHLVIIRWDQRASEIVVCVRDCPTCT